MNPQGRRFPGHPAISQETRPVRAQLVYATRREERSIDGTVIDHLQHRAVQCDQLSAKIPKTDEVHVTGLEKRRLYA